MDFKGRIVIITGSSMGIGLATALKLAALGAKVVINGRSMERLREPLEELKKNGYEAHAIAGDVAELEDCRRLIDETIARFGRIDVLVNNAGVASNAKLSDTDPLVFKKVIDANILGSVYPTMFALPHITRTKGSLIFISSVAAFHGIPESAAYSASKMALTAISQSLRCELAGTGVHVGIVYPGFTENDNRKRVLDRAGDPVPVPYRPKWIVQAQTKVADAIIAAIAGRKKSMVLSFAGKMNAIASKFFPGLVSAVLQRSKRKFERAG
jgi:NAD(P)-dependent dehydrogenase (short-subunit alcohol dehydrogenase family)